MYSQPATHGRIRSSFADDAEIAAFAGRLHLFERGEINEETWRPSRVTLGAYGQRQEGVYMLRVKLPQGAVTADQLRVLADVASRHAQSSAHLTTRQNLQLHFLGIADLVPAMRRLAEAGMTTSGSGGNTMRNVVACPRAGVSPDEVFDVTPYAESFTRHFLRHPLAESLPRKFKAAFEGCARDHVATAIQDLAFQARLRPGRGARRRGFRVTVAGGAPPPSAPAPPLLEFLPAGEILALGEAVVRVFHSRGDRVNRQRGRLKFLVRALGLEAFRSLVLDELKQVQKAGGASLPFDPERPPVEEEPRVARATPLPAATEGPSEAARLFFRTNVAAQRQPGWSTVTISLPLHAVSADQLRAVAGVSEGYGDGAVRFTNDGHILLRWIRTEDLPALHADLLAGGLARDGAGSAADPVACPGADVCRLALTRTRVIARLVEQRVRVGLPEEARSAKLTVRVSGCPNGCSRHVLAAIGLQGGARRNGGRPVPHFHVFVGGHVDRAGAVLGRLAGVVPASRVSLAVERLVSLYLSERSEGEEAASFFCRVFERAKGVLRPFVGPEPDAARPDVSVESGAPDEFGRTTLVGECAS